jgi:hypothetical protein
VARIEQAFVRDQMYLQAMATAAQTEMSTARSPRSAALT